MGYFAAQHRIGADWVGALLENPFYCLGMTGASGAVDWIVACWLIASCQRPSRSTQTRMLR
jgi:hypothetical protein